MRTITAIFTALALAMTSIPADAGGGGNQHNNSAPNKNGPNKNKPLPKSPVQQTSPLPTWGGTYEELGPLGGTAIVPNGSYGLGSTRNPYCGALC